MKGREFPMFEYINLYSYQQETTMKPVKAIIQIMKIIRKVSKTRQSRKVKLNQVRQGKVRQGKVRQGKVRQGKVRQGKVEK